MRIGEIASLTGVSTRTVRYYHQQGLLPEPRRLANGYRSYGVRDAVRLARIRRLVELGLSLEEVRDVLTDEQGRDFHEILAELDADLAGQEAEIRARRARLAELIDQGLGPDDVVPAEFAPVLRGLGAMDSPTAAWDREVLSVMATGTGPADRERAVDMLNRMAGGPGVGDLYRRVDQLAGASPDDPRVPALAEEVAKRLPAEIAAGAGRQYGELIEQILTELAPAQAEVFRRALGMES